MAGTKEIRLKIKSVQNTRKITKAMEMVAASKMKKAQERMRMGRPYALRILNIAMHAARANTEYRHPLLTRRPDVKRVGVVVITTDKGLCGGLNTNLLRMVLAYHKEWAAKGIEAEYCAIGTKGFGFVSRMGGKVVSQVVNYGDRATLER
jgi:F-type H+-transporting ATPase subunit gamma